MTRRAMRSYGFRKGSIAAGLVLLAVTMAAARAGAQAPPETKALQNSRFRFTVALPTGCRHVQGPGTLDAVCSSDFDPERSASASKASALVLTVAAEAGAGNPGATVSELEQRYSKAGFKEELPEAICGESDRARVKISNVEEIAGDTSLVYTADVVCEEVEFLQIGERRASVRHVITPQTRYRLMARALAEDFKKQRQTIEAFFASFRVLPAAQ